MAHNEWYTPPDILSKVREVIGSPIALDVASCEVANRFVGASTYYTEDDNGLEQTWDKPWFCNPPYSRISPWVNRAVLSTAPGILLVPASTGSSWFRVIWSSADAICLPWSRVSFIDGSQENPAIASSPRHPGVAISLFGGRNGDVDSFSQAFGSIGAIITPRLGGLELLPQQRRERP